MMATFAITYAYTDDVARRDAVRPRHRAYLGDLAERGINLASGPFGDDDTAGALLIVRAEDRAAAVAALADDPFQREDVVASVSVNEWRPVIGAAAAAL